MKVGRRMAGVVALAAVVVLPACGGDDSAVAAKELRREMAGAELKIDGVPTDGHLAGNVVELKLSGAGDVAIVKPNGDTSGKTGHFVVFVDRPVVAFNEKIPDEPDVIESEDSSVVLAGFVAGKHVVGVALADGEHKRIGTAEVQASFDVSGVTVRATAPKKLPANQTVVISVAVEQVGVVTPEGSTAQGTGHFDVFIDRKPTAAGQPVPTERGVIHTADQNISVPNLSAGIHTVWVVLVKGDETPFDPMIADKVTVDVA